MIGLNRFSSQLEKVDKEVASIAVKICICTYFGPGSFSLRVVKDRMDQCRSFLGLEWKMNGVTLFLMPKNELSFFCSNPRKSVGSQKFVRAEKNCSDFGQNWYRHVF